MLRKFLTVYIVHIPHYFEGQKLIVSINKKSRTSSHFILCSLSPRIFSEFKRLAGSKRTFTGTRGTTPCISISATASIARSSPIRDFLSNDAVLVSNFNINRPIFNPFHPSGIGLAISPDGSRSNLVEGANIQTHIWFLQPWRWNNATKQRKCIFK